ncbi:MAG: thioredoxin [Sphingomonadales bacterium 32-68-7]|nr:MAG: thioredoxin [Sphingomonadales bacterium 12-68-11]OYX10577.1 MAG: thioredoxin [Sphingomonadales bacterium 32-68-7]
MIIACPACTTRYVVPDSAIGPDGRTVRCAKCRHSWFQDGPALVADAPVPEAAPLAQPSSPPPTPEPPPPDAPVATPREDEERAPPLADEPLPPPPIPPAYVGTPDAASQFDPAPPFSRRANPLRLWTWAAASFAALAAATIGAAAYFGVPDWLPVSRPTFAAGQPDLELAFPVEQQQRRQLASGTEYFAASGSITNTGGQARRVPPILIVLRDGQDRKVYEWVVQPAKRSLAPGESIPVNEAVTDVPRSARFAEFGWKPD